MVGSLSTLEEESNSDAIGGSSASFDWLSEGDWDSPVGVVPLSGEELYSASAARFEESVSIAITGSPGSLEPSFSVSSNEAFLSVLEGSVCIVLALGEDGEIVSENSNGLSSSSCISGRLMGGIDGIMKSSRRAGVISPASYWRSWEDRAGPLKDFLGM